MANGRSGAPAASAVLAQAVFRTDHYGQGGSALDRPVDIARTLAQPLRRDRQADGRVRYWAYIPRLQSYIRVVTLADGETVHNVFKDTDFTE